MAGNQQPPQSRGLSRRDFAYLVGAGAGAGWLGLAARGAESRSGWRARGFFQPAKWVAPDPATVILLDSNENPHGPSPAALDALLAAHKVAMRYPNFYADELQERLASFHDVDPEMVVVTCGSTELLKLAARAFLGPGRRLVVAEPTFEAIVYYGQQTGAEVVKVPVTSDYRLDLEAMGRAAAARPSLLYLCNPNNPTGTIVPQAEVAKLLARLPAESVVVSDEAYWHYVDDPAYASLLDEAKRGANVVMARTFSKIYGMAGLRLGYGVAPPRLMEKMRPHQVIESWNVMACWAALASLRDNDWVERNQRWNREGREALAQAMQDRKIDVIPSQTNFMCIRVGRPIRPLIAAFLQRGIAVGRPFAGLDDYLRISLGTPPEMERFLDVLDAVLAARSYSAGLREPAAKKRPAGAPPEWALS